MIINETSIIYAHENARFKRTFFTVVLIDVNNNCIPITQQRQGYQ